jgi:hypothetical protein
MFKFNKISQLERDTYQFEDAVTETDILNGAFGEVADGKFTASEDGTKVVMQLEYGDDEDMPEYKIPAGSHVRVLDTEKLNGALEVYGYPLPDDFKVGDTLGVFTITEIIGNKVGAVVKITE